MRAHRLREDSGQRPKRWFGIARSLRFLAWTWLAFAVPSFSGSVAAETDTPVASGMRTLGDAGRAFFDGVRAGADEGFEVELFARFETESGLPLELAAGPPWPFLVRQDGASVEPDQLRVSAYEEARLGVACVVVIDVSPTMSGVIDSVRDATFSFFERIGPMDRVAVVSASARPVLLADFDTSLGAIEVMLEGLGVERDPSPTRLLDAVDLAVRHVRASAPAARSLVLVISDGSDGGSARSLEQVREAAISTEAVRIPIYGVVLNDRSFGERTPRLLRELAEATGAGWIELPSPEELPLVQTFFEDLWRRMRRSAVIRFSASMDGRSHALELIADGRVEPGVRVVAFPRRLWNPLPSPLSSLGWVLLLAIVAGALVLVGALAWRAGLRRSGSLVMIRDHASPVRFPLRRGLNEVGSMEENDIVISAPAVSRMHAVVRVSRLGAEIHDRDSTNGTWVNERCVRAARLEHGDEVRLGDVQLRYER